MKKIILLPVLIIILGFMAASPIWADAGQGLIITPKRVVFAKGERFVEVLIANRGNTPQKYRISVVNRAMQENGQLTETDKPANGEFFAKDVIKYSPRQVVLEAKESQKIKIMQRLKSDAPDGEYRSHLLVQEVPKAALPESVGAESAGELGINIQAIFGITLPIILRKGDLSAQVSLSNPKIQRMGDDTYLNVDINRNGSKSVIGTANVFAESEKIGILKNIAVYMSTPIRNVSIKLDSDRAQSLSGKNIRITYGTEDEIEDAPETELRFKAP